MEDGLEASFLNEITSFGYRYVIPDRIVRSNFKTPYAEEVVMESLRRLNPSVSLDVLEQAYKLVTHIDAGILVSRNERFFDYLQNGVEVSHYERGEQKTTRVYIADFQNVDNNDFMVTNQWTVVGKGKKRPDIVIFLNGLPIVVIELKSAISDQTDIEAAYNQIKNYQNDVPELFIYNAFNIISDMTFTKVGTITANKAWYKEWKSLDGSYESTKYADYHTLLKGVLDKKRFLDILKNFILFEHKDSIATKIMAQYHQYFAVNKAVKKTLLAMEKGDGRGGVFWHTQGSGKSLSMVFYTKIMTQAMAQPTFVILTDRNDLDDQLYGQFSRVQEFLRQAPVQAESRAHLKELLNDRKSNGIFFTTMQKFAESEDSLTDRSDVIVITDEAHRSQYGLRQEMTREGHIKNGMARLVRKSLPNAIYIGFTGTPLSENDKDTQEVFGGYIDVYDMTQAVEDGATKPIFYENRVINLNLNEEILHQIDEKYAELAENADELTIEKSKQELSRMDAVLGSDKAVDTLVKDIILHYEENRANTAGGKAMIVAYNRKVAIKIYKHILALRPDWKDKVKPVITSSNNDPEEWKPIIGTKSDKDELARKFKDNNDPMKIAIVVDMWLTGFDVPSLATMYIYKPMKGHNLMQAIARVNRVFEEKEGGLIVDYIGIGSALKEAMSNYTTTDKQQIENADIRDSAYPLFQEKLEVVRNTFFYHFNYSRIFAKDITDIELGKLIQEGVNYIFTFDENKQKGFKDEAYALKQAHTLCSSISTKQEQREAAFFEAVRISVNRISSSTKMSKGDINEQINKLLQQSIHSDGVINLFQDFEHGFSIFDANFIKKIEKMEQKNLSVELLNKLLRDEIQSITQYDIIVGRTFSERLKKIMKKYRDALKANAESFDSFAGMASVVNEDDTEKDYTTQVTLDALIALAKETISKENEHEALHLTRSEIAFYNALANPEEAQMFYTKEQLIQLTKELTETIVKEMGPDWMKKQSGVASVKRAVKRLLKKNNYPGDFGEVITIIIKQAQNMDGVLLS